jgi:hypothetical protein
MTFAEAIEPRLAPDGDLDPIVDWASKLVGATARIAGLIHIAEVVNKVRTSPEQEAVESKGSSARPASAPGGRPGGTARSGGGGLPPVNLAAVERAIAIAEYLIPHAHAAYAMMGLDPTAANVPTLLGWIKRTGRPSFTRRDARHALRSRLRSDSDLDDALLELEHHGYVRLSPQPRRPGQGRPASPLYDVHPTLVRR